MTIPNKKTSLCCDIKWTDKDTPFHSVSYDTKKKPYRLSLPCRRLLFLIRTSGHKRPFHNPEHLAIVTGFSGKTIGRRLSELEEKGITINFHAPTHSLYHAIDVDLKPIERGVLFLLRSTKEIVEIGHWNATAKHLVRKMPWSRRIIANAISGLSKKDRLPNHLDEYAHGKKEIIFLCADNIKKNKTIRRKSNSVRNSVDNSVDKMCVNIFKDKIAPPYVITPLNNLYLNLNTTTKKKKVCSFLRNQERFVRETLLNDNRNPFLRK